jgi:L-lactate dehydrogenase (cytochrome)
MPQMTISSPLDFRAAARRRLPRFLFDYADGGAGAEVTMQHNLSDLCALTLRQRVLKNVADPDLSTTLFGEPLAMPIILGPIGISGMYHRRGEVQAARAAKHAGIPFCLSTVSICSLSEISSASPSGATWFQLYVIRDRSFMTDLIAVARDQGAKALVFTVDMPVPGVRYRDARSGMTGRGAAAKRIWQAIGRPSWAWNVGVCGRPHELGNLSPLLGKNSGLGDYMGWLGENFDPSITWSDIEWIRAAWDGPLIIKGILDVDDARAAVEIGADGIVVSNHGGRQLDGVMSTARALPAIADAVRGEITVLVDSGIRTGLDVVKMMALGAEGVLLGRAWLFALAAHGEAGVNMLLRMIEAEMRVALALTGTSNVSDINMEMLSKVVES